MSMQDELRKRLYVRDEKRQHNYGLPIRQLTQIDENKIITSNKNIPELFAESIAKNDPTFLATLTTEQKVGGKNILDLGFTQSPYFYLTEDSDRIFDYLVDHPDIWPPQSRSLPAIIKHLKKVGATNKDIHQFVLTFAPTPTESLLSVEGDILNSLYYKKPIKEYISNLKETERQNIIDSLIRTTLDTEIKKKVLLTLISSNIIIPHDLLIYAVEIDNISLAIFAFENGAIEERYLSSGNDELAKLLDLYRPSRDTFF